MITIREELKILLAKENITMTELAKRFSEREDKECTVQSISRKLIRGTLSFNEAKIFADVLGYDIIFQKR